MHTLLMEWSGIRHNSKLESGYRFVTDPRRYFRSGPFLRPADKTGPLSRRIGPLGIEDVQHGKVAAFFGYKEASAAAGGRNYVIVYTGGLGDTTPEASKFVILAAFSRQVLDGAIRFLLSRGINNHWLAQVHHCGPYTETLLEFDVDIGQPPVLQRVHHPRTLGR